MSLLESIHQQIESEFAAVEQRVRTAVETAILRSVARLFLSRLKSIDAERQADYSTALQALGDAE